MTVIGPLRNSRNVRFPAADRGIADLIGALNVSAITDAAMMLRTPN
jgi:hypothetical protein